MNQFPINEDTKNILISLASGLLGFASSLFVEWFKKRKNPKEVETDISYKINTAAKDNVATAQSVIDILDDRLSKERVYYEEQIDRSKHSSDDKILELKEYYENKILELKKYYDKALFDVQIKGEQEKFELSKEIEQLKLDKVFLQSQVSDLQTRLGKYEDNAINGKHE